MFEDELHEQVKKSTGASIVRINLLGVTLMFPYRELTLDAEKRLIQLTLDAETCNNMSMLIHREERKALKILKEKMLNANPADFNHPPTGTDC